MKALSAMMQLAALGWLLATTAAAQPTGPAPLGESSLLRIGLVDVGAGETRWRDATALLSAELRARTSIEPAPEPAAVRLADPDLFRTPLLVLSGARAFSQPPASDLARLRRFLAYGGLLLIDDAGALPGGRFDRSARALVKAVLPSPALAAIRGGHVLYKSFYLLDGPAGRVAAAPALEAVEQDGRILVLFSPNDLGTPLATGEERAVRLAVNVVLYALCLDYKEDQVHTPFILRRRRWRPEP